MSFFYCLCTKKNTFFSILFIFLSGFLYAQDIISLKKNVWTLPVDSVASTLDKIGQATKQLDLPTLKKHWQDLLNEAEKRKKTTLKFEIYKMFENILSDVKHPNDMLRVLEERLAYAEKMQIFDEVGLANMKFGEVYRFLNKPDKSLSFFLKALDNFHKTKNKSNLYRIYSELGNFYCFVEPAKSREYVDKALTLKESAFNTRSIISNINTIALTYQTERKWEEALKKYEEALKYAIEVKDIEWEGIISGNMAMIYMQAKDFDKALIFMKKDLELSRDEANSANTYQAIGEIYALKNDYNTALKYLDTAFRAANKIKNINILYSIHSAYYKIYKKQNDSNKAYPHLQEMFVLRDSIYKKNQSTQIKQIQSQYDFDKQEEEIGLLKEKSALQHQNLQQQKIINVGVLVGILILAIFSYFIYRNSLKTRKLNNTLYLQKEEILAQNEELRQNQEELATQRDYIVEASKELAIKNNELASTNDVLAYRETQVRKSIEAALSIQQAILPYQEKMDSLLKDHFLIYRPKDVVSGDFYWLNQVDSRIILVVADCTGHGVQGAFMTLIGSNLLDKIIRVRHILSPADILNELHNEIQTVLKQKYTNNQSGMDAIVVALNPKEEGTELTFAGAKTNLLYLDKEDNTLKNLKATRKGIGGHQNEAVFFEEKTIELKKGSILYVGSDGLVDQNNTQRVRLGNKTLQTTILDNIDKTMQEQKHALETLLTDYMEGTEQRDDILYIGIRI